MEFREIKKLVELFSSSEIDALELNREGFSLKLAKKQKKVVGDPNVAAEFPPAMQPPIRPSQPEEPPEAEAQAIPEEDVELPGLAYVKSPIVGTFYAAPNPKAAPFVKVGDSISVGQTLCIVEAMKLMNEIQSETAGELVTCYVENAQPVEYGQKLFAIKPY